MRYDLTGAARLVSGTLLPMMMENGSVTNSRLRGLVMVSKGTTTYHYPHLDLIWEKAKTIFEASSVSDDQ